MATVRSEEDLKAAIAGLEHEVECIRQVMKRPLLPIDRACYHADRKEIRAQIKSLQSALDEVRP